MKKVLLVFDADKLPGTNPTTIINKINKLLKNTSLWRWKRMSKNRKSYKGKLCKVIQYV